MDHVSVIEVLLYGGLLRKLPWVDAAHQLEIIRKCRDAVNGLKHRTHGYRVPDVIFLSILDYNLGPEG